MCALVVPLGIHSKLFKFYEEIIVYDGVSIETKVDTTNKAKHEKLSGHPVNLQRQVQLALGKDAADFLMNGASNSVLPVNLQSRMGMGTLLPATGIFEPSLSPADKSRQLTSLGGAVGSFAGKMLDSGSLLAEGSYVDAAANMLPKFADSLVKAGQMAGSGTYRNNQGQKITDASKGEAVMKALDMNPERIASEQRERGISRYDVSIQATVKAGFTKLLTEATQSGDSSEIQVVQDKIDQWNTNNPLYPVDIKESTIAKRVKRANQGWKDRTKTPKGMEWMDQVE